MFPDFIIEGEELNTTSTCNFIDYEHFYSAKMNSCTQLTLGKTLDLSLFFLLTFLRRPRPYL